MLGLHGWTGFSSCDERGLLSRCGTWVSHCSGLSCCEAWAPGTWASVVKVRGLSSCSSGLHSTGSTVVVHRFTCTGLLGMWGLPGPGIKPVSAALAEGFFTPDPPGKPTCGPNMGELPTLYLEDHQYLFSNMESGLIPTCFVHHRPCCRDGEVCLIREMCVILASG